MRTYTHTYICTNTYTYVRTYRTNCMYLHCTKMCACTYIRTYASMCVPTCISVCRVIELETLTQVRSNLLLPLWRLLSVLMCFQSCCYARTQKHTHTHMHMYAHTYTTHMYSHTQTHTMFHVCIHLNTHTCTIGWHCTPLGFSYVHACART